MHTAPYPQLTNLGREKRSWSGLTLFQPDMASTVTDYCTVHSENISESMQELWAWTCQEFEDADKMSSPLQGVSTPEIRLIGLRILTAVQSTFKFLAQLLQPKRSMYYCSKPSSYVLVAQTYNPTQFSNSVPTPGTAP